MAIIGVFGAILLFLSFTGWGRALQRLIRCAPKDYGFASGLGMAFLCTVGGLLNYFSLAGKLTCAIIVVVGVIFLIHDLSQKSLKSGNWSNSVRLQLRRPPTLVLLALLLILGSILFYEAAYKKLNGHDDEQAYLVFAVKMLETGSIGNDPFSERRMLAYGGQSFLHALFLSIANLESINCVDLVTGRLVFLALVIGGLRSSPLGLSWKFLIALLVLMIPAASVNISSTVTGLALFYGLFRFVSERRASGRSGTYSTMFLLSCSAVTAIFISGLSSLKHTFIPASIVTSICGYMVSDSFRSIKFKELTFSLILAALFLAPWMLASYNSSGTLLFPLLGRGYHGTAYGVSPDVAASLSDIRDISYIFNEWIQLIQSPEFIGSLLLVLWTLSRLSWRDVIRDGPFVILVTVWVLAFLMGPLSGGFRRYIYPFTCPALILASLMQIQKASSSAMSSAGAWRLKLAVVVLTIIYWHPAMEEIGGNFKKIHPQYARNAFAGMEEARKVQGSAPEGVKILTILSRPALLDFKRNTIYVVDHAGASSPPPGMPIFSSAEDIASYLRKKGIRYLMYGYRDAARFDRQSYVYRLALFGNFYADRLRLLAENSFRFRDRISELAERYKILSDDGFQYVLDLESDKNVTVRGSLLNKEFLPGSIWLKSGKSK